MRVVDRCAQAEPTVTETATVARILNAARRKLTIVPLPNVY